MSTYRQRLLHAHHAPGMTWRALQRLHAEQPHLEQYAHTSLQTLAHVTGCRYTTVRSWQSFWRNTAIDELETNMQTEGIMPLTVDHPLYPWRLRQMPDPPWVIYCKGDVSLCERETLAVVGTRQPSKYGVRATEELLPPVAQAGRVIVSGLAKGIDTIAHQRAILAKGKTIAVIAGGLSHIYPRENQPLADDIAKDHLILSEYPPTQQPQKWHFPERNRIISALSDRLFVVEAGERSGTLITVDQALEQGRDVCALPGSIYNQKSIGTNRLIEQGAGMVLHPSDL
ncbi:DNA-processing protein DprA [Natribacillus halophilus]|uniref:DNA processing protein n=1 Tax=Natribacillus halophilus TaxID=549003 RepID=A0A1G8PMB2_9BACI|nr:DNA-processing protein DprA [Natribacillus halophilus]SDI93522.1 DNA processing protein [Natribacillus halophilus]